jgi:protein-S-isoprenylcysteine O-methyltransferase Ste14
MAATALAIYVIFVLLAFVWRSWLQYRRTGDHGYRGFSGRAFSAEWFGGVLLLLGGGVALLAPIAELWLGPAVPRLPVPAPAQAAGVVLMLLGVALTLFAQVEMGASWRIGVEPGEVTALVTTGLFARIRNPIFAAMLLSLLGLALAVPNALAGFGLVASLAGIELHVRVVEEPYLLRAHGERYRAYARRAGRFVPGIGRLARRRLPANAHQFGSELSRRSA